MSGENRLPPWVWVGCGCIGAIAALTAVAVSVGFWGLKKARDFEDAMRDPKERTEKCLAVLGAERLPDGYHAVISFSIPFVLDFAILSDRPPNDDGTPADLGEHGFVFMSYPNVGEGDEELYDFFEGRTDDVDSLRRENVNVDLGERVGLGRLDRGDDEILWVAHRGKVRTAQVDDEHDGLVTLTLFECGDERRRLGIWFGPDPDPDRDAAELALDDTVADPVELETFMTSIKPCG